MSEATVALRVVMVSSDISSDIEDGLELNAEPTVILQGGIAAVRAAAVLFGESVVVTRTPSPDPAALVKAAVTPPLDRTDESVRWYSGEATASELLAVAERRAAAIRSVSPDPAALADLDAKGDK